MYISVTTSRQRGKTYHCVLLRESYREGGKVKHRTIANLSKCSEEEIKAISLALKHKGNLSELVSGEEIEQRHGKVFGAVYTLYEIAKRVGIVSALGNSRQAKLCLWLVLARLIQSGLSRLSAVRLAREHAVAEILGVGEFTEDDLYGALDWVEQKQAEIEEKLFKSRNKDEKPRLYLYDVTSSYLEGRENEYGEYGYSRDKKKGKMQIVIGLLTDGDGWPVSIEVFKGNTRDFNTFRNQIDKLANRFNCEHITIVGDRGMIKSCQIEEVKKYGFYYITAITRPQIEKLLKQGAIQLELFTDELCEVTIDGVRYILRKNPVRAEEMKKSRNDKIEYIKTRVDEENKYLKEHPRAKVESKVKKICCVA